MCFFDPKIGIRSDGRLCNFRIPENRGILPRDPSPSGDLFCFQVDKKPIFVNKEDFIEWKREMRLFHFRQKGFSEEEIELLFSAARTFLDFAEQPITLESLPSSFSSVMVNEQRNLVRISAFKDQPLRRPIEFWQISPKTWEGWLLFNKEKKEGDWKATGHLKKVAIALCLSGLSMGELAARTTVLFDDEQ